MAATCIFICLLADANEPSQRGSPVKRSHIETNLIRSMQAGKTTHILALDKWRGLAWLESPRMPLQTHGTMTHTHAPLYVPLHTSLGEPSP